MADWSGRPAYAQVADQLREAIRSAVRELKTEGLVYTHQGKGAFVRDPLPPPGQPPSAQGSEAFQAVVAEIRSLHDDLDRVDERLARVERLVLPDDT